MTQWGVDAIFNPSKRHMDDEKRRLQATRQEVGDNSGGRRIDLLSGKVRIPRSSVAESEADADNADHDNADDDTAAASAAEVGVEAAADSASDDAAQAGA